MVVEVTLTVDGKKNRLVVDTRTTLLAGKTPADHPRLALALNHPSGAGVTTVLGDGEGRLAWTSWNCPGPGVQKHVPSFQHQG